MRLLKRSSAGIGFTRDLSEDELRAYDYAILSHTWGADEEEVTYKDVLAGIGTTKAGAGSAKVRFCMEQTARDELEYFWIDTCCIDKTNLVELDRSLRSMYRWYANAKVCYVFLPGLSGTAWQEDFRKHRWFRRGWTLQELIAPANVEFFSGGHLGSKRSLEKEIAEITGIPVAALRGKPTEFSVVERRRWQEGRETREPEDLVYSLLGILDVSMPVLYGEGRAKAWDRLEGAMMISRKGRHDEFSLVFSLDAAVEQHFAAREDELVEVHRNLASDGSRKVVVLQGPGGIGKTQLAISYAKLHRDDYSAVLWLLAKGETSVRLSFARMARQILRDHPEAPRVSTVNPHDLAAVVEAVKAWLSIGLNTRWLLICDNYDDPNGLNLRQYLPEAYQGSVLITTRSADVSGCRLSLEKLKVMDGLKVLEKSSGRGNLVNNDSAVRLAQKLDGLPLALATAGAHLSQSGLAFDEYLCCFEKSWARLYKSRTTLMTYDRTLYSTCQISYDQIKQRNSAAAQLLQLWAYFDNQDLWFELLEHIRRWDVEWAQQLVCDRSAFDDCMRVLCNHRLVEVNAVNSFGVESIGYSVHACVHSWMTTVLNEEYNAEMASLALKCVAAHAHEWERSDGPALQWRLLGHANRSNLHVSRAAITDFHLAWAYHNLGMLYVDQGKLVQAEMIYTRALAGYETLGPEHMLTLDTVINLGNLHRKQSKMELSEKMYLRALAAYEKVLGPEHSSMLETVNKLILLYKEQGRFVAAEQMYLRTLTGFEEALGPEHLSTLLTVGNLGNLYRDRGKLDAAEHMYLRALAGYELAVGPEHMLTLQIIVNIALLRIDQDLTEDARALYERVKRTDSNMIPESKRSIELLERLLATADGPSRSNAGSVSAQEARSDGGLCPEKIPASTSAATESSRVPAKAGLKRIKVLFKRR